MEASGRRRKTKKNAQTKKITKNKIDDNGARGPGKTEKSRSPPHFHLLHERRNKTKHTARAPPPTQSPPPSPVTIQLIRRGGAGRGRVCTRSAGRIHGFGNRRPKKKIANFSCVEMSRAKYEIRANQPKQPLAHG